MIDEQTVIRHVERDALILDEHVPGWYHRINVDTLDMAYSETCIGGQLDLPEPFHADSPVEGDGFIWPTEATDAEVDEWVVIAAAAWLREIGERIRRTTAVPA